MSSVGNYLAHLKTEYMDRVRKLKDTGVGEDQGQDGLSPSDIENHKLFESKVLRIIYCNG